MGLFGGAGDAVLGLFEAEALEELLEPLAVLGEIDGIRRGAEDRDARVVQRARDLERGLAAELDDDAVQRAGLLLKPQDLHHMLSNVSGSK